jgi:Na+-driven multidrug efflux pump
MSHLLRSAGYSKESGFGLALGGISNIILDPLFMFVILPPGNEVTGAAIATLCSNVITLIYFLFIYSRLKGTVLTMSPKLAKIEKSLVKDILSVGLPSALSTLLANITSIVKNNLTSSYGDIEMAAYGIVIKADMLPLNIGMGLCQGMMPLVAYNYAARNYPRMRSFTRAAQIAGMATACVFIVLYQILARQIIWIFIKDDATIAYGTNFLRIACLATPFMISNFQKIFCLQAMGKGKESLLLSACRQGLFAIPILLILNYFIGLYGVVAAQLISDSLTFIIATLIYKNVYNKLQGETK